MKVFLSLCALALAICPTIASAGDTPVVGATTIELVNPASSRKIAIELWYRPSGNPKAEDMSIRAPLRPLSIARNAAPDYTIGKQPLIILSHGNWGSRYSQGWLALKLVNAGYVVLSVSHPGTLGDDQTAAGRLRLWDRSHDVSFSIDEVLKNPKWATLIDDSRIGFAGHSFGGWTGVSLAGGKFDPALQRVFCTKTAPKDAYCEATLKDDITGIATSDAANSFKDSRIIAFYIMASGPAPGFATESLKSIRAPFVVDTAQFDEILDPRANSSSLAAQIPGAKEIIRHAGHFAYVPECRPVIGKVLTSIAGLPLCNDPSGVDRAAVHQQIAQNVITFFNKALPAKT